MSITADSVERWLERNAPLQRRHTLQCPSHAQWLLEGTSGARLKAGAEWARKNGQPVHILGQGSNVLVAGFVPGLTLVNRLSGVRFVSTLPSSVQVDVGAGINWHWWVCFCVAQGWHGLENLALIPGTVGAAPVQNIGAYGVEVGDWIEGLEALDLDTGVTHWFAADECAFGYRQSRFKRARPGQWCILRVRFSLARRFKPVLDYGPLQNSSVTGAAGLVARICRIRQAKLPDPASVPNAGSFFTNPLVTKETLERLRPDYPDIPYFPMADDQVKIAAGWLIDQAGMRGFVEQATGVGTYPHQALVLINPYRRHVRDLEAVAQQIVKRVDARFGIALEREPQWLGGIAQPH